MREYPKIDGKELTQEQKDLFDRIEKHILWNKEVFQGTEFEDNIEIIAYNSAFSIVTDNKIKL